MSCGIAPGPGGVGVADVEEPEDAVLAAAGEVDHEPLDHLQVAVLASTSKVATYRDRGGLVGASPPRSPRRGTSTCTDRSRPPAGRGPPAAPPTGPWPDSSRSARARRSHPGPPGGSCSAARRPWTSQRSTTSAARTPSPCFQEDFTRMGRTVAPRSMASSCCGWPGSKCAQRLGRRLGRGAVTACSWTAAATASASGVASSGPAAVAPAGGPGTGPPTRPRPPA